MNKILITGFQHSGTTMLMGLLRNHPQVGWIELEKGYIEYNESKKWLLQMASLRVRNLKDYVWGEKLPWGNRKEDLNAVRPIGFTKKWLKYFGKNARVLHILRHPIDVAASGTADGKPGKDALKLYDNTIPKFIDFINNKPYCATILYEDLLLNPNKSLRSLFNFCGLMSTEKILNIVINGPLQYGEIKSDKAYSFKKRDVEETVDYDKFLSKLCIRL
jgi:hypothetical protein